MRPIRIIPTMLKERLVSGIDFEIVEGSARYPRYDNKECYKEGRGLEIVCTPNLISLYADENGILIVPDMRVVRDFVLSASDVGTAIISYEEVNTHFREIDGVPFPYLKITTKNDFFVKWFQELSGTTKSIQIVKSLSVF